MKRGLALASAAVATASVLLVWSIGLASDHLDGPLAVSDPQSDLTDVFAFTSPEDPSRIVLALAVAPYATDASTFSPSVDYVFRVRRVAALQPLTLDDTVLDVTCRFAGTTVTCSGPLLLQASAVVGQTSPAGGSMRVFAGPRSDPAFFDRQGALATLAAGQTRFTGQNAFAGANVLALVVELPSAAFLPTEAGAPPEGGAVVDAGPPTPPILAVSAETIRRGS